MRARECGLSTLAIADAKNTQLCIVVEPVSRKRRYNVTGVFLRLVTHNGKLEALPNFHGRFNMDTRLATHTRYRRTVSASAKAT
ncbi:hypothetical protein EBR66_04115 [bacterium]|nr:hypothetical protein [bacterium]